MQTCMSISPLRLICTTLNPLRTTNILCLLCSMSIEQPLYTADTSSQALVLCCSYSMIAKRRTYKLKRSFTLCMFIRKHTVYTGGKKAEGKKAGNTAFHPRPFTPPPPPFYPPPFYTPS